MEQWLEIWYFTIALSDSGINMRAYNVKLLVSIPSVGGSTVSLFCGFALNNKLVMQRHLCIVYSQLSELKPKQKKKNVLSFVNMLFFILWLVSIILLRVGSKSNLLCSLQISNLGFDFSLWDTAQIA